MTHCPLWITLLAAFGFISLGGFILLGVLSVMIHRMRRQFKDHRNISTRRK